MSKVNCICYSWTFLVNLSVFLSLSFLPICVSVVYGRNAYTSIYSRCRVCVSVYESRGDHGVSRYADSQWVPFILLPLSHTVQAATGMLTVSPSFLKYAGMCLVPHVVPTETSLQCPFSPFKTHCFPLAFIVSLWISHHASRSHLSPHLLTSALCRCNLPQNKI